MRSRATSPCRASLWAGRLAAFAARAGAAGPAGPCSAGAKSPAGAGITAGVALHPRISPVVTLTYCPKGLARRFGKVLAALLQDLFLAVDARCRHRAGDQGSDAGTGISHGAAGA